MRTDSVSIAKEAQANARKLIGEMYGDEYVPEKPNFYKSRGSAQEAHEAIRPTDVTRTPDEMQAHLDPQQAKLYRLIWTRFVASQMAPAVIAQRSVEIDGEPQGEDAGSTLRFRASASEILFPGYMKATGEDQKKKKKAGDKNGNGNDKGDEDDEIDVLPPMEEGELLDFLEALSEEKETQPPPRYSEASLVRVLEENGVGRPSTYAAIISTLLNRNYVEKEKRSLRPTGLGQNVNKFLVENLDALFNVEFTAKMEESLDQIESGNVEWTQMLSTFYNDFAQWVEKAKGPPADENQVRRLLELLEGVNEWKPPQKRGKRTYSDEKFVDSVRRQFEAGEKKLSQRQAEALMRLAARYKDQLPKYDEVIKDLGLENKAAAQPQPPLEATIAKLEGLKSVQFDEPREVRGRTYDDGEFVNSLRQQVEGGRRLSHKQVKYLDRLVTKYAEQLGGVEEIARKFDVAPAVVVEDPETGDLLDLLKHVTTWKDPVQRGKRTWDDHKFYESLRRQYKQKNSLSEKQVSSLKKMIARYADQVPDFESAAERFDIKTKKKKKAE
jgi:DNA topoisomerase-1